MGLGMRPARVSVSCSWQHPAACSKAETPQNTDWSPRSGPPLGSSRFAILCHVWELPAGTGAGSEILLSSWYFHQQNGFATAMSTGPFSSWPRGPVLSQLSCWTPVRCQSEGSDAHGRPLVREAWLPVEAGAAFPGPHPDPAPSLAVRAQG